MHWVDAIKTIDSEELARSFGDRATFALDILVGLSEYRKSIPSKYLYDEKGSQLFQRITELPEYYLTNCEREVLQEHRTEIASYVDDQPFNLVELGPGDGGKTEVLIEHLINQDLEFNYVPIDISRGALEELHSNLRSRFPGLQLNCLESDFFTGIKYLNNHSTTRNLVLFLGSNIGNFSHAEARFFLRNLWNCLNNDDILLIGFDLKKDIEMLLWAYNDRQGVTAAFNLNVLSRINRELGGDFDKSKFRHFGTYDVFSGAMESYLVSLEQQSVFIEEIGRSFDFRPWEPIHMEYSYKYLRSDIDSLAAETGYRVKEHMTCSKGYFLDSIWEVRKTDSNGK